MSEKEDLRTRLGIVDALLFALGDPTVLTLIEESHDREEATTRLLALGMSMAEATEVLDLPYGTGTVSGRLALQVESATLRQRLHNRGDH